MGERAVVTRCVALLEGRSVEDDFVFVVGGEMDHLVLSREDLAYWLRVWGARGLLYAWDPVALPVLVGAVTDESWRVREMVAKVVAKRRLDDAAGAIATLRGDEVPRVRSAAERALRRLAVEAAGD
jgi:hypothetical protein